MSFTESNTVEQMILDAATTLGSGAGSFFTTNFTNEHEWEPALLLPFLFVKIRAIRG